MIIETTVRRARVSGYQKKNRRVKGDIFLPKQWIGKKVAVIPQREFVDMKREMRAMAFKLNKIGRMSHEYISA